MLGVDRIDCSKGILHRMRAFERFLELNPAWRSKATLLQVTPVRGQDDKRLGETAAELAGLIGKINGRFGDAAWTPIRYVNRCYSRGALAGLLRLADVALVTPLRDGMNLVAKEFVAAQDSEDPGALVLSQFAGAANELDRALIVNPHETDAVAAALKRALEMPLPERRERHATMLGRLMNWDVETWSQSYVSALVESHSGRGIFDGIRSLFGILGEQRSFATQGLPRVSLNSARAAAARRNEPPTRSTRPTRRPRQHPLETRGPPCFFLSTVALRGRREGGRLHGGRFRSVGTGGDRHRGQWRDRSWDGEGARARWLRRLDLGAQSREEPRRFGRARPIAGRLSRRGPATSPIARRSRTRSSGPSKPSAGSTAASPTRASGRPAGRPLSTAPRTNGGACSRLISTAPFMSSKPRCAT